MTQDGRGSRLRRPTATAGGLLVGMLLDGALGDPRRGHPVAGFGRWASLLERRFYSDTTAAGTLFAAAAILPLAAIGATANRRSGRWLWLLTAVTTWSVVGGRSLCRAGLDISDRLKAEDLDGARTLVPTLCGRDPASLDADGIARAVIESIAENTSDSIVAPLFWGAVAGVPGLIGYRAVNTLDAMVGHRSPRYQRFGSASARLDDLANLVPARVSAALTVLSAPLAAGSPRRAWQVWQSDAAAHPSPNAGPCEAAMAGALGVGLGGRTVYGHRVEQRPALGHGPAPTPKDIDRSVCLSRAVQILSALAAAGYAMRRAA